MSSPPNPAELVTVADLGSGQLEPGRLVRVAGELVGDDGNELRLRDGESEACVHMMQVKYSQNAFARHSILYAFGNVAAADESTHLHAVLVTPAGQLRLRTWHSALARRRQYFTDFHNTRR
jgi:hypothetical protein